MPPPPVPDAAPSAEPVPRSVLALNLGLSVAALLVTLLGAGARSGPSTPAWAVVPLLVALVIAASLRVAYRFGTKIEDLDVFEAVLAPVLLLFDVPAVVALVVVAKVIAETIARREPVKAWFNVSQWALAAAVGAVTFGYLHSGPGLNASALAALVAALLAVAVVNHAALVTVMSLATRTSPSRVLHELQPAVVSGWLLGGALNVAFGLLVAAAAAATPLVTILFVVPLGVLHLASQHLALEASRRNLRRATQDANAVLSREVDPCDNPEPFLAVVLNAFAAEAVRLVVFSDAGSDVHHIGAPPELAYEYWRSDVVADPATVLQKASMLGPGESDAALLEPGLGHCLAAPVRTETRTSGVLWVIEPQRLSRDVDVDLAALTAMADGLGGSFTRAEMVHAGFAVHRRSELLLAREGQVLQSIACGDDLEATLAKVADFVEDAVPDARCVIAVSSTDREESEEGQPSSEQVEERPHFDIVVGDGPTPPISFLARTMGNDPTPEVLTVSDVNADDRWNELSDAWQGFRSCWVTTVDVAASKGLVGAVCVAHPEARDALDEERAALDVARRLAGLAVARTLSRDQLLYEVRHDRLTGLSNRTAFLDDTNRALARHRRTGLALGVLFLDLDGFKYVNDNMGHDAGDLLLVDVATRLQAIVRTGSSVARYGGDEFTILCEDLVSDNDAFAVAERVATALSRPYVLKGVEALVTGSIGVALADRHTSAAELIERADAAMYRAKERGRNRIEVFDERTREGSRRRLFEQTVLRQALDAREFVVHYQPLFSLHDLALTGVEALVRWRQRDGTLVEPDSFIGLAEDTGLIVALGSFVLDEACRQAQQWRSGESNSSLAMSVNVSARQIALGGLVDTVKRALRDSALPAAALTLEITETALMEVSESAGVLSELRELGVLIAIDDFGTGYSSLDYLRRLPFDVIKLDRAFLQELGTDRVTRAIVSSVVSLAETLGLPVVAEGIETEDQLALVRDLGCSVGQGFHLGRPAAPLLALVRPKGSHAA